MTAKTSALLAKALREIFPTAHTVNATFDYGQPVLIDIADKNGAMLLDTENTTQLDMGVINGAQRVLETVMGDSADPAILASSGWKHDSEYDLYSIELPMTLAERVIWMGKIAVDRENNARVTLAARLMNQAEGIHHDDLRALMVVAAEAKPWRQLLEAAQTKDALELVLRFRARLTEQLITYSPQCSTDPVRTAANLIEHDGLRRFLVETLVFVDFE
jgi:hypothetical protein